MFQKAGEFSFIWLAYEHPERAGFFSGILEYVNCAAFEDREIKV